MKHLITLIAILLATACTKPSQAPPDNKNALSEWASAATGTVTARTEQDVTATVQHQKQQMYGRWRLRAMTNAYGQTVTNADPCWADDWIHIYSTFYEGTNLQPVTISQGDCITVPWKPQHLDFWYEWLGNNTVNFSGDTVRVDFPFPNVMRFYRDAPRYLYYDWTNN